MMAKQRTSFSSEDAEVLLNQIQQFYETLRQEWSRVLNQWGNLKLTWRDEQFYKFESLFEDFAANYGAIEKDCEEYMALLQEQIQIAEQRKSKLGALTDL